MTKFVCSNNIIIWDEEGVLQQKKTNRFSSDDDSNDDLVSREFRAKRKRRKRRKDSPRSILDPCKTFLNYENLQFNNNYMVEDNAIIEEEFGYASSEGEEEEIVVDDIESVHGLSSVHQLGSYEQNFQNYESTSSDEDLIDLDDANADNDANSESEIKNLMKEIESVDLSIQKLASNKQNLQNCGSSSNEGAIIDLKRNKKAHKKRTRKSNEFSDINSKLEIENLTKETESVDGFSTEKLGYHKQNSQNTRDGSRDERVIELKVNKNPHKKRKFKSNQFNDANSESEIENLMKEVESGPIIDLKINNKAHKKRKLKGNEFSDINSKLEIENLTKEAESVDGFSTEKLGRPKQNSQNTDGSRDERVIALKVSKNPLKTRQLKSNKFNDENSKLEIENLPKEAESVDGLSSAKLGSNKQNVQNTDSSSDESIIALRAIRKLQKKRKLKRNISTDESEDDIDFEEALQQCTNSHEKSQLVERVKIKNKAGELTVEEISVLEKLQIAIPWSVPICHSIETRASSYPTKKQKEQFSELGIKFAAGPYNNEENAKIKENWSEFCKSHNIEENPKLFLNFIWDGKAYLRKKERINFVKYLAKDLEHRPLWSIYERFQRLFSEKQRGNFTSQEDDIIMAFYENSEFPNKNSALTSVLNRNRVAIKNRYGILKAEDSKNKFTPEMDQVLLDHLMELTRKTCISDLKTVEPARKQFKEIASKMDLNWNQVKRRWELVLKIRLFVEDYIFLQEIREKLIDLLSEKKYTDRRAVNWKHLATHFETNITSGKLYHIFIDLVRRYVPEHRQKSFTDIVECLTHSKNHMTNTKIRKYNYEGKKLI